jgi:hypothetical protein
MLEVVQGHAKEVIERVISVTDKHHLGVLFGSLRRLGEAVLKFPHVSELSI